jgi:hypothetical protein
VHSKVKSCILVCHYFNRILNSNGVSYIHADLFFEHFAASLQIILLAMLVSKWTQRSTAQSGI